VPTFTGKHRINYINNFKFCHFHLNIFSHFLFLSTKQKIALSNSEIHDNNICFSFNLHLPSTNLTMVQKGVLYSGSNVYNHLPLNIKILSKDAKKFK
jgi:hypothetical protein